VATPATAVAVAWLTVPLPEVNVAVTVVVFDVTRLVPESSTSTTGWITKGAPAAVVADGWVTMTSFAATAIGNVVVAEVSRLSEKVML